MDFYQLVKAGRIKNAISSIPVADQQDETSKILLSSRFSRLEQRYLGCLLSESDYQVEFQRIVSAATALYQDCTGSTVSYQANVTGLTGNPTKTGLSDIYNANKRRNPEFAKEVKSVIDERNSYEQEKQLDVTFDRSGRRQLALARKEREIIARHYKEVNNSAETKIEEIKKLIDPEVSPVPSWDNLEKAWTICKGLGMSTHPQVDDAIKIQPEDDEVKIRAAEYIEGFLESL